MHVNSLLAYWRGETSWFGKRERAVLDVIEHMGRATDRAVMMALGFVDMNTVRPTITHLRDDGVLEEVGEETCPVTNHRVRLVAIRKDPRRAQAEFVFAPPGDGVAFSP
jgi:hypothetical protein